MKYVFDATINSDSTEGRGPMVSVGLFDRIEDAVVAVQDGGVMGHGTGDVDRVPIFESWAEYEEYSPKAGSRIRRHVPREKVYGYRKDWKGSWGYGFVDNRDAPAYDPDYVKYKELQKKLEQKYQGKIPE